MQRQGVDEQQQSTEDGHRDIPALYYMLHCRLLMWVCSFQAAAWQLAGHMTRQAVCLSHGNGSGNMPHLSQLTVCVQLYEAYVCVCLTHLPGPS
jgi:hypothetical protein